MATNQSDRVLVLGGGVVGLSIAFRLAGAGVPVTVLERGDPGGEASGAAGGILGPQLENQNAGPLLELSLRSRTLYPAFVRDLEALTGIDTGYRALGVLRLAFDEAQTHELAATAQWQHAFHLRAELLGPEELRQLEPAASPEATAGLFLPEDHQVEPRRLLRALVAACERLGVELRRTEVLGILEAHGAVTGVRTSEGEVLARRVVLALGAWSGLLDRGVPVEPVKGQILELRAPPDALRHLLYGAGVYLVPREDGRVLVGSTMERVGFDKRLTESGQEQLRRAAERVCPMLREASVNARWAGLRPDTGDHLPFLGAGPLTGLMLATGHFRNGVLLAPITARLVVECITGGKLPIDPRPFAWDRDRSFPS